MKFIGKTKDYFELVQVSGNQKYDYPERGPGELSLIWFKEDDNHLIIDDVPHAVNKDDIVCLTEFHHVEIKSIVSAEILRWNKEFYCVINHDSEVGCRGILFYGAETLPHFHLDDEHKETFMTVWKMLKLEMQANDNLQEEMLQMMLKRILILCTRIYKSQSSLGTLDTNSNDLVREYHFLVEQHFKDKHAVADYARMLFKSPKTLSNVFKKLGEKTPLQFIQDRKMLEARRLLSYTDKTVSDIGYELGFRDVQSFSRFFKKEQGVSPIEYKQAS